MNGYIMENIDPISTNDDREYLIEFARGIAEVVIQDIFVNTVEKQMSNWQKLVHKLQTQNMSPYVLGSAVALLIACFKDICVAEGWHKHFVKFFLFVLDEMRGVLNKIWEFFVKAWKWLCSIGDVEKKNIE
uniref:Uncharacterized protein n=1 Tax=Meloidogyne enterolobii TaxID=390850 RepID=A0A6V7VWH7_MELEN|nr:unnamed protein product [Meloidogyne enterolobii]CAD2198939.1 unnamed protein product [Meloidogyne enterolobii]